MRAALSGFLISAMAYHWVEKYLRGQVASDTKAKWERKNFAQQPVSLSGGVKLAAASVGSSFALLSRPKLAGAHLVATTTGSVLGYIDDLQLLDQKAPVRGKETDLELVVASSNAAKGFHGHLSALKQGQITTGFLKIIGIGSGALAAAWLLAKDRGINRGPGNQIAHLLVDSALIAGSANLTNLFDLRPGRALKVATLAAGFLTFRSGDHPGGISAGAALGMITKALPADLSAREMLGDTGANALGAHLGTAAAMRAPLSRKMTILGAIMALTIASEKVSFSKVIAQNSVLCALDNWGRKNISAKQKDPQN